MYANMTFGRVLGEGSYSTVIYGNNNENKEFAVKIVDKKHVLRHQKQKYVMLEKQALSTLSHSNIIKLFATYQDDDSLYFVLEYCPNGDLLELLNKHTTLDTTSIEQLMAQLIHAVNYIHSKQIIHRDLKPENILLSAQNHIKLCDFGTVKFLDDPKNTSVTANKRSSFVGTAEYTSPELLQDRSTTFKSDVWALGCILYQLTFGKTPFKSTSEYLVFKKIMSGTFPIPQVTTPESSNDIENTHKQIIDLITTCLTLNPSDRPDTSQIMSHPFFASIDWDTLDTLTMEFKSGSTFTWLDDDTPPPSISMHDESDSENDLGD
jgi:serine/threonine protein kinase